MCSPRVAAVLVPVALALVACSSPYTRRVVMTSVDGVAAEDGPRLVARLQAAGVRAVLGPAISATSLALDLPAEPPDAELVAMLEALGRPTRLHVHAVPPGRGAPPTFTSRAEAEALIATLKPEADIVPVVAEDVALDLAGVVVGPRFQVVSIGVPTIVGGPDFEVAGAEGADEMGPARVVVGLAEAPAKRFEQWTKEHVDEQVAIMVDDEVLSMPIIKSTIGGGRLVVLVREGGNPAADLAKARWIAAAVVGGALGATWTPGAPSAIAR